MMGSKARLFTPISVFSLDGSWAAFLRGLCVRTRYPRADVVISHGGIP
jgi:hypothetical protein